MKLSYWLPILLLATPLEAQSLRVAAQGFEPFFYRHDGQLAGLEYELLEHFAKSRGEQLDVTLLDTFGQPLEALVDGTADIAVGTISITPERRNRFDFSASYFPSRIYLVEPLGRSTSSKRDLAGARLATMRGTTYETILAAIPGVQLLWVKNATEMLDAVERGEAVGAAIDSAVAFARLRGRTRMRMTLPLSETQHYGFAVRKGSPLAAKLSSFILDMKTSGIYYRLLQKYLGDEAVTWVRSAFAEERSGGS